MSRDIRRLLHTKEGGRYFMKGHPGRVIREGEEILSIPVNKPLTIYRKQNGTVWELPFSSNGNQHYIDKTLTVDELKYKRKFIDYRFIVHNFNDDIGTDKIYIPWYGELEQVGMNVTPTGFLAPFRMTLHKLYVRPETLTGATADLTFRLEKQDDGDTVVDSVASYTYTTTLVSDTLITINKSDWDAAPTIDAGNKAGLSIQASSDPSGAIDWYVTSVWKVEVIL